MLRARQAIDPGRRDDAGFTLIEVLEFILAASLAVWLSGRLASRFHGVWHALVFCAATFVGTAAFGFSIMIGLAYGFDYIKCRYYKYRRRHKTSQESNESNRGGAEVPPNLALQRTRPRGCGMIERGPVVCGRSAEFFLSPDFSPRGWHRAAFCAIG
jgi:hypothetical protein